MGLKVRPIPIKRALRWVKKFHRRLPALQGGMWAIAALRGGVCVGVAIVGRPTARLLDSQEVELEALQILRVASLEKDISASGNKGVNSMLYGACARAARAMGATDLFTYIHADEPGTSLHAAGWIEGAASPGGEWTRLSRARPKTVEPGAKRRFYAPWSASLKAEDLSEGLGGR